MFRLRQARRDETDAITRLHALVATTAYAHIFPSTEPFPYAATLRRWCTFTGTIVVAEAVADDRALAGFVAFDAVELHELYVLPEHRGSGIGARLLGEASSACSLWVLRDKQRARRFYERYEWELDGAERQAHGVVELRYRRRPPRVTGCTI